MVLMLPNQLGNFLSVPVSYFISWKVIKRIVAQSFKTKDTTGSVVFLDADLRKVIHEYPCCKTVKGDLKTQVEEEELKNKDGGLN